jgi:ABC-type phosphate transport system substrate-binding protein
MEVQMRTGSFVAAALLVLATGASTIAAPSFVVIVNTSVPGQSVRRADLAAVFLKKALRWGDGSPATPVDQSGSSAVRREFSDAVLKMPVSTVVQYWQKQLLSSPGQLRLTVVKESDDEVLAYVARTSGAVGYVSLGTTLPDRVKVVSIID